MPAYVEALRRFVANSQRFGRSPPAVQEEFQFNALARLAAHAFRHSPS